jgi:uncharacterized protein YeaO (DUF488 family)
MGPSFLPLRELQLSFTVKRVYEPKASTDGVRVLVDRLWPRGLSKEKAAVDHWLREAAPSTALRKWYGHDPEKWPEFQKRYFAELDAHPEELEPLIKLGRRRITLLFGSTEERLNNAHALKEYMETRSKGSARKK